MALKKEFINKWNGSLILTQQNKKQINNSQQQNAIIFRTDWKTKEDSMASRQCCWNHYLS